LPGEYARAVGRTPVWLFHGSDDNVVPPKESELMFDALKVVGGNARLWVYVGMRHDCWTRAFNEPELPRWLLAHRLGARPEQGVQAERILIPLHPPALKLTTAALDSVAGDYRDLSGHTVATIYRQGEQLFEKNPQGDVAELAAESANTFFYPNGSIIPRITFERDGQGRVTWAVFRDDRHEERWEKRTAGPGR
jgi:hypothetical protein